uniref:hypothetical protein n=1 Tax=Lachnoclostridium phocaeense TaxID=1871021 RepID=UPI0026DC57B8|nr:hypothetical protein [Lachnoclostridium phocaeense]
MENEKDILLSKYHVAVAMAQDLKEQLSKKQEQWEKREEDFKITEKLIRELCESILAKDPKEMVLGTDYSWSSVPVNELIGKAKKVFTKYIETRKDFMRKIMEISETRREQVESLQDQISVLMTRPSGVAISRDELEKQVQEEKMKKEAVKKLTPEEQKKADRGNLSFIVEEDADLDAMENLALEEAAEVNASIQITPKSIPITPARKQVEQRRERRENAKKAHMIDLKEYENKMDAISWDILRVIGKEGLSVYNEIEKKILEEHPDYKQSRIRMTIGQLFNMQLVNKEPISNPLKAKLYVYQLTAMGSRVFQDKFKSAPEPSEMDQIMAEHDNCNHGYGIKFIAEMLRESRQFRSVNERNRKNPIKISTGVSYIPDIICTDKNGKRMYIEYECMNYTQTDFSSKCSKICKVTDELNYIAPNVDTAKKLYNAVEKWIESRGRNSLSHVTVRITTALQMKDKDIRKNENWKYVFEPGKQSEGVCNF